jgi:hypothetical protein
MSEAEDVDELLFRTAVRADAMRAAGLRGLEDATRARQLGLEREHGRLSGALGATHPRTRAIAERIKDGTARVQHVAVEAARAETTAPRAEPSEWIFHGHVRGKDLKPAPDLTLTLVDASGRWVEALGSACTDAKGYFRIVVVVGTGKPGASREPAASATPQPGVHACLTDASRTRVYRGEELIAVQAGSVEYREIVLGQDDSDCAPPEAGMNEPDKGGPGKKKAAPPSRKRRSRE